jgi:DNA-binding SARP family transcriptional activator
MAMQMSDAVPPSSSAHIELLDGFELRICEKVTPLSMTVQRLLAFLALRQKPVRRMHTAVVLWDDADEGRAGGCLRSALWRVRRLDIRLVEATGPYLGLSPSVSVDLREATSLAARLGQPGASADVSPEDADLLRKDLLPDWYEDWVLIERERFRQLRLHALEALSEHLTTLGEFGRAIEIGQAALSTEPLRESAHRLLIQAFKAEGNRVEAARQYSLLKELLWNELGVEPSKEISGLVDQP